MRHVQAFIYAGPGAGLTSVNALERALFRAGMVRVKRIGFRDLVLLGSTRKNDQIRLLCVPGGRDLPLLHLMTPSLAVQVQNFVASGGRYLGICSGAYFAARAIAFAQGMQMAIEGPRPLRFFAGVAVGPTHKTRPFSYAADAVGEGILVSVGGVSVRTYTHGGCALVSSKNKPCGPSSLSDRVLAYYGQEADNLPAARLLEVGVGRALLMGFHLEWQAQDIPNHAAHQALKNALAQSEAFRAQLFSRWLCSLCR